MNNEQNKITFKEMADDFAADDFAEEGLDVTDDSLKSIFTRGFSVGYVVAGREEPTDDDDVCMGCEFVRGLGTFAILMNPKNGYVDYEANVELLNELPKDDRRLLKAAGKLASKLVAAAGNHHDL